MAALSIQVPYPVFYDRDGQPLDNGNIYIGVANLDPVANPLQVYYDEALTILASQPLITSGGYVYRNGTPTQLYVNATDFSITVNDSNDLLVYNFPQATGIIAYTGAQTVEYDPPFAGALTTGYSVADKLEQYVSVKDFGAVGDGVTDDYAAFQAAVDASDQVYIPAGTYALSLNVELRDNSYLFGDGMGASVLVKSSAAAAPLGLITANTDSSTVQFSNITLRDFEMRDSVATLGFSEFLYLVNFSGVNNALIERVKFYGFRGDGLYIGQWTNAAFTRLNTNITVRDCVFDGVNKDNRQGISVITGENILITGCDFRNITRSNMPGAIDFEPNGVSGTEIIRNCRVIGNSFNNIGGNIGAVAFAIPSNILGFSNIIVANNSFLNTNRMVFVQHTRVTTNPQNIVISGNTAFNISQPFEILGRIRGASIIGNTTFGLNGGLIGFDAAHVLQDIIVSGNTFSSDGTTASGGLTLAGQTANLQITNNTFNNWNDFCVLLGINAGDNLSKISITNNGGNNLRGAMYIALQGVGTTQGNTCVYKNNIGGSNNTSFWLTDDPGLAINSVTAVSFNSATLPDSFPAGNCISLINGDTGVPNTGGYQGTLVNFRPNSVYTTFTYQLYYPANNTVDVGSFFLRKRANASNTWTAWYKVTGV